MSSGFFHVTCLLYCIVLTSFTKCDNTTSKIALYIGGFFGVNIQEGAWSTAEVIPSLEMALEHVNNDPSILVDYQLKYVWNDSKVCSAYMTSTKIKNKVNIYLLFSCFHCLSVKVDPVSKLCLR